MNKNKKNLIVVVIITAVIAVALIIVVNSTGLLEKDEPVKNERSSLAPDFTLEDADGAAHSLKDFRGKYVILNFWGSWCSFCVKEMPDFQEAHEVFSVDGDTIILPINDTSTERSLQNAIEYINKNNFDMLVLYDLDGKVSDMYNVEGYPTTYVIDKSGYIYAYQAGALTKENLFDVINSLRSEEE